jgi:hypothetical protein
VPALAVLLLLAQAKPFTPLPEESYQRVAHAARRTGPIELDGKLDEEAWKAAPVETEFTQATPDEGSAPTVKTSFRILWDDEYFYLGAECEDPEPLTVTLTRRDRSIEGDFIQFDLDTTYDRRTAYHFQVYASGTQQDGIHFNDTDTSMDWDAAWESAVHREEGKGWSVEIRIPLRVMRIPEGSKRWGFNFYRVTSRRHEEDQWRFRPNGRNGNVSRLGVLEGLEGIHPVRALELRPYLSLRLDRNTPPPPFLPGPTLTTGCATEFVDPKLGLTQCVGADFRYNLASDLILSGTVNPDFGQVEADQRVLNLTTFETFFPEKRPFFLEGLDLFTAPLKVDVGGPYGGNAYQMFYSRRIGRGTPSADDLSLTVPQQSIYQQATVPIASAVKLSGTVGQTSVGAFSAIEPRVFAQVATTNGQYEKVRTVEARNDTVLRVRAPIGDQTYVGVMATSADPIFTDPAADLPGMTVDRMHAHVGEGDLTIFSRDRSTELNAQALGSVLTGNTPQTLRDGTYLGSTASGGAFSAKLKHVEEYWFADVNGDYLTPRFSVDTLGFMNRANLARAMGYVGLQAPHPNGFWQNAQLLLAGREVHDSTLDLRLDRDLIVEAWMNTPSGWFLDTGTLLGAPYVDDRELLDGTPLERQGYVAWYGAINSDSRKPLQVQFNWTQQRSMPRFERQNQLDLTLFVRPMPQLDGSLELIYNESAGTFRQIRPAGALPCPSWLAGSTCPDPTVQLDPQLAVQTSRQYILAQQQARSVSAILRGTWSFTPRLTLQAYAQLFTADIAYGAPYRAVVGPGKPVVRLDSLTPALASDLPPDADDRSASLNVNVILRWEWRTGSTLYLVYAHNGANDLQPPPTHGLDFHQEVSTLTSAGATRGDSVLVKVDLLSAL